MNESTTELAVIAWIPSNDEHLTIAEVHAIGGQIIDDEPVSYSTATARAFTLSQETSQSQGHYIPVAVTVDDSGILTTLY